MIIFDREQIFVGSNPTLRSNVSRDYPSGRRGKSVSLVKLKTLDLTFNQIARIVMIRDEVKA